MPADGAEIIDRTAYLHQLARGLISRGGKEGWIPQTYMRYAPEGYEVAEQFYRRELAIKHLQEPIERAVKDLLGEWGIKQGEFRIVKPTVPVHDEVEALFEKIGIPARQIVSTVYDDAWPPAKDPNKVELIVRRKAFEDKIEPKLQELATRSPRQH